MTSVLTNSAAITALKTLRSITQQLDITSNRVSTGQRVSSAADNAAYWSIATTVRSDNASLGAVKDSLGLGSSAVDTAYNGLNSIITDLQNIRTKLQTALTPGIDRSKVQTEIKAVQNNMKATADSSNSSGQNWLSVDSSSSSYQSPRSVVAGFSRINSGDVIFSKINIDVDAIKLYDAASSGIAVSGTPARVTAGQALTQSLDLSGGQTIRFGLSVDGAAAEEIVLDRTIMASAVPNLANISASEVVRGINNQIAANPALRGTVRAGLDESARLWFETTASGTARSLTVDRVSTGGGVPGANLVSNGGFETGLANWSLTGNTSHVSTTGSPHSGAASLAMGTVGGTAVLTRTITTMPGENYVLDFWLSNGSGTPNIFKASWDGAILLSQIDAPSQPYTNYQFNVSATGSTSVLTFEARQDPNYWHLDDVAVRRSPSDVSLGFGSGAVHQSAGYGTDAMAGSRKGILDTVSGTYSIDSIDIGGLTGTSGDATLATIITQVDKALAKVTDAGTKLGANKTQIDGQKTFVDSLMKANQRTIGILVDADIEEESTKLKALQTQQQLGVQSLSIATPRARTS